MFNKLKFNKKLTVQLFFAGFCLLILTACFNNGIVDSKNNIIKSASDTKMNITWQEPLKESDKTIIPGYTKTDSGQLELRWIIRTNKEANLVILKSQGSSELPLKEKKIMPLVLSDEVTLLFQEWPALINKKKPFSIHMVTSVSTADLFSVFPVNKKPPYCTMPKTASQLIWGTVFDKKGVKYLQGTTSASFGSLNLLWKKDGTKTPELIIEQRPGSGELPAVERKLLPWTDESAGVTYLCQERYPLLNQGFSSYLWCLSSVNTSDLFSGFDIISGTVSDKK